MRFLHQDTSSRGDRMLTGAASSFRGMHGEVASAAPAKGYESVDVLYIDG